MYIFIFIGKINNMLEGYFFRNGGELMNLNELEVLYLNWYVIVV